MKNKLDLSLMSEKSTLGMFSKDFVDNYDLLTVAIAGELYMIKPIDLEKLVVNVGMMSATPPWNAHVSYYKNGRAVYTNRQMVLSIYTRDLDPKVFIKLTHNKKTFDNEEAYQAELSKVKKANFVKSVQDYNPWGPAYYSSYIIKYPTNDYFLYLKAYMPLTNAEQSYFDSKFKNYNPNSDYYKNDGKDFFENNIKNKTIAHNGCEFYFNISKDDKKYLTGTNSKNEHLYLSPFRIYFHLQMEDCAHRFNVDLLRLFYGKPSDIYIENELKNDEYILEWFDW